MIYKYSYKTFTKVTHIKALSIHIDAGDAENLHNIYNVLTPSRGRVLREQKLLKILSFTLSVKEEKNIELNTFYFKRFQNLKAMV